LKITVPISVGDLLDKISILQIKSQFTNNTYVIKEREHLIQIAKENDVYNQNFLNQLLDVNYKLWTIENKLREFEKNHIFDEEFIRNARLVYITNDKRATIKKEINEKYNSEYQEVKCYV
tara:strand:+ start:1552 stop:1911 length:360 start_codon:yes stop_codon:yes gene_type:complete